jgi:hypothetical protein
MHAGGHSVVQKGIFWLFVGSVSFFVHNTQKVVGLRVLLVFGDDFPTKSVELSKLINSTCIGIVQHELDI